jgi:hypothetical protein|tara:strand:- start:195 stop:413 length:219 start_codon:yes stop_codon:yes gene_type:complete
MSDRENKFLEGVASDCRAYSKQYACSLAESVSDWEGDGPSGSWGLTNDEEDSVCCILGIEPFHYEGADFYEY